VRLPRDWLGPREDLVPIGSSTRFADEEPGAERPPTANDFWGETSATLQDTLDAPAGRSTAWIVRLSTRSIHAPGRATTAVGLIAGLALIVSVIGFSPSTKSNQDPLRAAAVLSGSVDAPASKPSLAASIRGIANHAAAQTTRRGERGRRAEVHRTVKRAERAAPHPSSPPHQTSVSRSSPERTSLITPSTNQTSADQTTPSAETSSAASDSAISQTPSTIKSSPPAGPTGRVALIGAGTSPSG
jgi:hypothetical protein